VETPYDRGARIKELREAKKLTQAKLGEKVGVGKATVSKWEKLGDPNIELLVFFKLADALDIEPRELATGRADERPKMKLSPASQAAAKGLERLHPDLKLNLEMLIQTLVTSASENYHAWSTKERTRAKHRDTVHDG
jgi:transcriptional regulator with XRE-family HTH domain